MLLAPRLSSKALADLSHRLALETDSGIDIRRTWKREAESARGAAGDAFGQVRNAVARGESLSLALAATGGLFPPLFLEMVHVGEQTGTLGEVFRRLAQHYEHQYRRQRMLLAAVAWPMIELGMAVLVIGLLIAIQGAIGVDILGFGLTGTRGVILYANFVIAVALAMVGLVVALRRGVAWTRRLQRSAMRLPVIGGCLEKIALARLAWVLHLTLNVEMDLRRAIPLVLRATGNDYYSRHTPRVVADVAAGMPIHEALDATGALPSEFIDALAVADQSGAMVEAMDRLSHRYEEQAESALQTLTRLLGLVIWLLVMGLIVAMIFRLAGFYLGAIDDALQM